MSPVISSLMGKNLSSLNKEIEIPLLNKKVEPNVWF